MDYSLKHQSERWDEVGHTDPLGNMLWHPDGEAWDYEALMETGRREIQDVLDRVRTAGLTVGTGRALDFGCGIGRLTQALCTHFDTVDGVDISASLLEMARQRNTYPDRCAYHLNTSDALPMFEAGTFDFIYSFGTLQYVPAPVVERYLAAFARLLAPGGVLVFQLPTGRPSGRMKRLASYLLPLEGYRSLRYIYWPEIRYGTRPDFRLYGVSRPKVERYLTTFGLQIADVAVSARRGWVSCLYVAALSPARHAPASP